MTDSVKIELGLGQQTALQFSHQNYFIVKVWTSEKFAKGIDDATASARDHRFGSFAQSGAIGFGEVVPAVELIAAEHEAAAFSSDVLHGGGPGITMVGCGRAIDFNALRIHVGAEQRHVIFPTDHGTKASERGIKNRQSRAVTIAPDQPLRSGGHYFTMLAQKFSVRRKEENTTVERATIALNHADHKVNGIGARSLAERLNRRPRNFYRAFKVALEIFTPFFSPPANDGAEVEAARIAGDKCLRKKHELRALAGGVMSEIKNFLQSSLAIKRNGRRLHHGDAHSVVEIYNRGIRSPGVSNRKIRSWFGFGHQECRTIQETGQSSQTRMASVKSSEALWSLLLETLIVLLAGALKSLCFQFFTEFNSTKPLGRKKIADLRLPEQLIPVSLLRDRRKGWFLYICGAAMVCLAMQAAAWSQAKPADTTQPTDAAGGFLQSQGAQPRFESGSKLSSAARMAVQQNRVSSIPHFSGSFALDGTNYPYTMVGSNPLAGGITEIPTDIIPISMFFEGYVDDTGNPLVLDPGPILSRVQGSPNFRNASYQTGTTQFADAVQRAQFFHSSGQDWHTMLGGPQFLQPVRIDVPKGAARVYRNSTSGATYAVVDSSFFISQLNTIIQLENLRVNALAIALTSNVLLAPQSDIKRCCVLGFHTSFDVGELAQVKFVQTFIWASWMDPGILGASIADVTPMSHEISEWMNNPFGSNQVPAWQPASGSGCQSNLETADPLATLPNAGFPVSIDGFTYHPHNQVLLQWFQRNATSDAAEGAFSFPDTSLVTRPAQPCAIK
jgi:hypothetical protein